MKIDDLLTWRPDLERHIADLSDAVAALQAAPTPQLKEQEDQRASTLQPPGDHIGTSAGATSNQQGLDGHGHSFSIGGSRGRPW